MNEIEKITLEMIRESTNEVNEAHNRDYKPVIIYSNDLVYVDCALYADTLQTAYNICQNLNKLVSTSIILHFNHIDVEITKNESYEEILEKYNKINAINHKLMINRKYEIAVSTLKGNDKKKISRTLNQLSSFDKNNISISLKQMLSHKLYQRYTSTKEDLYLESKIEKVKQYIKK